jgi:ferredoxin
MLALTASERKDNSRLACQLVLTDALEGIVVTTPPIQQ